MKFSIEPMALASIADAFFGARPLTADEMRITAAAWQDKARCYR